MSSPGQSSFLGVNFHLLAMQEAADQIIAQGLAPFEYVVTPNVQHMVRILEHPAKLRPLYEPAWRVLCDSRVLARLARLDGLTLPVTTGSDLTAHLIQRAVAEGIPVSIVGPGEEDAARLRAHSPGLQFSSYAPPFGFIGDPTQVDKAVRFVVEANAPIVFLAVGTPQQEILARRLKSEPAARGVGLCIGASIDFLTGKQQRAPRWMQQAELEWLHRLATNPVRLGHRYLVECPKIFYFLLRERLARGRVV
jgi:N-acetylglucosaminyldiphosphoundecaprenol N-acetyl-beta-D-mannosaminyltransferase